MVRVIRKVVASALHRCWTLLLRSLSPDIRAIAVSPLKEPERRLGLLTRFKLASSPPVLSTTDIPKEILDAVNANRDRFASGALFGPLESVTHSGAILVANITERGLVNADHFLAVYGEPQCVQFTERAIYGFELQTLAPTCVVLKAPVWIGRASACVWYR